jgi:hypothetical protein
MKLKMESNNQKYGTFSVSPVVKGGKVFRP